jgi:lysyl-tRNA synthetase class 2
MAGNPPTVQLGSPQPTTSNPTQPAPPTRQAQELRESGQEPYAYRFDRTHYTTDLQQQYEALTAGE